MKLATVRTTGGTRAARIDETRGRAVLLDEPDVGAVVRGAGVAAQGGGDEVALDDLDYAPLVPTPGKVLCIGLNYRNHILEMGRELPEHPTVFGKVTETLIGSGDDIALPPETSAFDWEGELAVVVGATVRRAGEQEAADAIAGFAVLNDVTCRDWQYHSTQWLAGKNWERTTPLGPWLVTPEEVGGARPTLRLTTWVDDELMQDDTTGDLVFDPVDLVRYLSTFVTLRPGDVIASGTPGGVGHARTPAVHLRDGQTLTTEIEGLGRARNRVVAETVG